MTGVIEWMQIAVTSEATNCYDAYCFNVAAVDFLVESENNFELLKLIFICCFRFFYDNDEENQ